MLRVSLKCLAVALISTFCLVINGSFVNAAAPVVPMDCLGLMEGAPGAPGSEAVGSAKAATSSLLLCTLCTTPALAMGLDPGLRASACEAGSKLPPEQVATLATRAVLNASAAQGEHWLDPGFETNSTAAMQHLVASMPARGVLRLGAEPYATMDFLIEHVRYAMHARNTIPVAKAVPWDLWLENVLPYAFIDEPRDYAWRWRPRFFQLLAPTVAAANISTVSDAVHAVVAAVPQLQAQGVLADGTASGIVAGSTFNWRSETAPAFLSPKQVAAFGGSCTGTAVVLAAALRSVGLPSRVAGCSQSVPDDDHHWVEFWDGSAAGPFGDYWHTKEGVSVGNAGGPWDAPSAPMQGCLSHVEKGSSLNTLWATEWSSDVFLPTLWHNSSWAQQWAFVGGVNRCAAYCVAWGCGPQREKSAALC